MGIEPYRRSSLDLDIAPRTRGNVTRPVAAEFLRELTPADIEQLSEHRGSTPPAITRLRDSHHSLAMALADGLSEGLAAEVAGYSVSRVSILKADPTFVELIEHYRNEKTRPEMTDLAKRMLVLGRDSVDELQRRLEETPDSFENGDLLQIVAKTADRTGFGPQAKSLNVNVHVGLADGLAAARARIRAANEAREAVPPLELTANE